MKAQLQADPPRLDVRVPPDGARLARVRERVRDYLRHHVLDEESIDEIVLAIEEACTNAIRHSGSDDDIEVVLAFDGDELRVRVVDHGVGFDPALFRPDRVPDIDGVGGRGLFLIGRLMGEVSLGFDGGTEVSMAKRVRLVDLRQRRAAFAGAAGHETLPLPDDFEDRLYDTLESLSDGFMALDWEWRCVYANPTALTLLRHSRGELVGAKAHHVFPEAIGTAIEERFTLAMEQGVPSHFEVWFEPYDAWYELRVYPTSSGVSVYFNDVTIRKRKELERDESRRGNELLARTAAALLSADDPRRVVESLCLEVMEYLGCHAFFNYLVDDQLGCLRLNAYAGVDTDTAQRIELLDYGVAVCGCAALERRRLVAEDIQHSDDERAELVRSFGIQAYAAHPLMVRDRVLGTLSFGARDRVSFTDDELALMKTVADYVAIAVDRQRGDAALRSSESRFRSLFESMAEGVALHELVYEDGRAVDYRIVDANPAFELQTGLSVAEARGRLASELYGTGQPPYLGEYARVVETAAPVSFETHFAPMERHFHITAVAYGPGRFGTVFFDVTDRKRAEELIARQLDLNTLLVRAANELAACRTLESVLDTLSELILAAVAHQRVTVSLWNEARESFVVSSSHGEPAVPVGLLVRLVDLSQPARDAIAGQSPCVIDYDALEPDRRGVAERVVSHLALSVPLYFADRLVGLIAIDDPGGRREFTDLETGLAEGLSAQAAAMIANARLNDELAARERLNAALNEINDLIHSTLDVKVIMQRVVEQAIEIIGADSAMVALKHGDDWVAEYDHPEVPGVIHESVRAEEAPFMILAVDERRPVAIDDCEHDDRCFPEVQRRFGVRSVLCIPLFVRDEALGVIFFNHHRRAVRFDNATIDFAAKLAAALSLALGNARLYAEQQHIATTLQENFLHALPVVPGIELGVVSEPAYAPELVGGDFSDVFLLEGGRVAIVVGDVAGKGVRAAGLTETVRSTVRAFATIDPSPAFVLRKTNEAMLRYDPDEPHVTALFCVLDPQTGHLNLGSAGHPPPVHVGPTVTRLLHVPFGPPLGAVPSEYSTSHVVLTLDDYLVLYTDGVVEARDGGRLFGEQRLVEVAGRLHGRAAQEVADGIREAAVDFASQLRDDLQVVALRLA